MRRYNTEQISLLIDNPIKNAREILPNWSVDSICVGGRKSGIYKESEPSDVEGETAGWFGAELETPDSFDVEWETSDWFDVEGETWDVVDTSGSTFAENSPIR